MNYWGLSTRLIKVLTYSTIHIYSFIEIAQRQANQ